MMQLRTKFPLFLCILMVSTTISLSIGEAGGSITDIDEASDGKQLFNASTTIVAGSSLSFENGRISGKMRIVIIAPCSSDNYQTPHLSPNSTDHNNIHSDAFVDSSSAHPFNEMACWRSSLNMITLHVQVNSGITKSIAEEHFSTGEKVLCGAFLCWSTDHHSMDSKTNYTAWCKDDFPPEQNAQSHNIFWIPFSAIATGRRGSSTALHCGLAKGNRSLYCWDTQLENGSFLAPVLLTGYGFQVVHPDAAQLVETGNEKRSSDARQLMVETPGRRADSSSHINVDIPVVARGAPSSPAIARPGANFSVPIFTPAAAAPISSSTVAPSSTTTPSSSSPTVAPTPTPTSSVANAPAPSFPAFAPAPAISNTSPAIPASNKSSAVNGGIKQILIAFGILLAAAVISIGITCVVLHVRH